MASKPKVSEATNRSWPDVAVEVIRLVGLPAVLVAGILYGFYIFYGLISDSHAKRDDALEQQLKNSRQALLDVFTKSHELQRAQIDNIQGSLKVHTAIVEEISKQQAQILKFKSDAEKAREEADGLRQTATKEREEIQGRIAQLNSEALERKAEVEKDKKLLLELEDRIRTRQETVLNGAETIEELRKKLQILAAAVIATKGETDANAYEIATAVSNEQEKRLDALEGFAKTGALSPTDRQSFVGLSYAVVRQLAKKSHGFSFFIEDTANSSIYGVGRTETDGYRNVIQFLSDAEKIVEIATTNGVAASVFPESENFFQDLVMLASYAEGSAAYAYMQGQSPAPDGWSIESFLKASTDIGRVGLLDPLKKNNLAKPPSLVTLQGAYPKVRFSTPEDFATRISYKLPTGNISDKFPFSSIPDGQMTLYVRSKAFDPDRMPILPSAALTESQNEQFTKSFKATIKMLLAVRGTNVDPTLGTSDRELLGRDLAKMLQYGIKGIRFVSSEAQKSDGKIVVERTGAEPFEFRAKLAPDGTLKQII